MRVHGFVDEGLGHSSYVIDLGDGTAAMVDPPRVPSAQERLVTALGLRFVWTLDTHSHADYVTASPALAARAQAAFIAPAASRLESPHRPVRTSTVGHERLTNVLFSITDEDEFVQRLVAGFGSFPSPPDR